MHNASFQVVVPARFASTRLPGKPLRDIGGKPMIQHVYERAVASGAGEVIVAVDDMRVMQAVESFGGNVCMTSIHHQSGTERIVEVVQKQRWTDDTIVVNVQGDEPLIPPGIIRRVAQALAEVPDADIATLCCTIEEIKQLFDPNVVKVVRDCKGRALYFSRAPIPWHREAFANPTPVLPTTPSYYHHIGIYSYRVGYLKQYVQQAECDFAQAESLEQLRALYNGAVIQVIVAEQTLPAGVDTEQDLLHARMLLAKQ